MKLFVGAGLAAIALVMGGCGESREDKVASVVEGYFDALSERDYERACSAAAGSFERVLADYAKQSLPGFDAKGCVAILSQIGTANDPQLVKLQKEVDVQEVTIDGDRAVARLEGPGQTAELRETNGDWKITKLDFSSAP